MGEAKNNLNPSNIWAGTGFGTQESNAKIPNTPSRLLTSSEELRNALESRNLYTDFKQYPLEESDRQKVVNSISTVLDTVLPFKSFSFDDSVLGRLVSTPTTPLTDIGLVMLGKQFALNFASNVAQETFPSINLRNVFDGDPETKLFQKNIDFRITQREEAGTLENFVEKFIGLNFQRSNPFQKNVTNDEYIRNTGQAQLDFLWGDGNSGGGLNQNIYKPNNDIYSDLDLIRSRSALVGDGRIVIETLSNGQLVYNEKTAIREYFTFSKNPYVSITPYTDAENFASVKMGAAYFETGNISEYGQEYAPTREYVEANLGETNQTQFESDIGGRPKSGNQFISREFNEEEGIGRNVDNQIVWGRDNVSSETNDRLGTLRGDDGSERFNVTPDTDILNSKFKAKVGLLKYTSELLNATKGQLVDQTRKVYKSEKGDSLQGSGLWQAPSDALPEFADKIGLRQHSILDQYDRFAKAIRFKGNEVYNGGNPNSVVFKSVLPRIHPTLDKDGNSVNKNLMFSLENLAVNVINSPFDKVGIIDDEFGTQIPQCEIGPNKGRIMWFPPYDISINETSNPKWDSTAFVGRNEPIYTYMYTERAATLSFKLLVDYPPQLRNYIVNGNHSKVAEFFAFGGPDYTAPEVLNNIPEEIEKRRVKINQLTKPPQQEPPKKPTTDEFSIVFPNDIPRVGQVSISTFDTLYNDFNYEIIPNFLSSDGTGFGLNRPIYVLSGITGGSRSTYGLDLPPGFTQSNAPYSSGLRPIDDALFSTFNSERNRQYYKVIVRGGATKLYTVGVDDPEATRAYNKALGQRRADVAKLFIEARIKKIFGKTAENLGIIIETNSVGDEGSSDEFDSAETIDERGAKEERSAKVRFDIRSDVPEPEPQEITPEDQRIIEELEKEITDLESELNRQNKLYDAGCFYNERGINNDDVDLDQGAAKGFQSVTNNYFYPVFHSQTPEDFHKRLTFLQQCTRQGSAIRKAPEVDRYGTERIKNSVFGRQPICVLRVADFFHTKVIIESINIDYADTMWDTNPEGWGMQPMIAEVTLQMKVIGGQSLKGPIDALQNAVSYNYYANSTFKNVGVYRTATNVEEKQQEYNEGVLTGKQEEAFDAFKQRVAELNKEENSENNIYGYNQEDLE